MKGNAERQGHVKDFKLNKADPGTGKFVNIRDDSVRGPAVFDFST